MLLEQTASSDEAFEVAERIITELSAPVVVQDHEIVPRASIGIVLSPAGTEDPADLMQAADVAMYAAKAGGKSRYEVYQPALQSAILDRLERTADLQTGDGRPRIRAVLPADHQPRRERLGRP